MDDREIQQLLMRGAIVGMANGQLCVGWGDALALESASPSAVSFYAPDFYLENKKPWVVFTNNRVVCPSLLVEALKKSPDSVPCSRQFSSLGQEEFFEKFNFIGKQFDTHALKKAVPLAWASSEGSLTADERKKVLLSALNKGSGSSVYGVWGVDDGGLLGVTPELLFEWDQARHHLSTMALAGTRLSASDHSLLDDPKEKNEHQLVVDALLEELATYGTPSVSPTYEWNVGTLTHLRTDITVESKNGLDFEMLARDLHPTPALGLAPRTVDFHWLKNLDGHMDRARFGAPFGVRWADGSGRCLVAIRNVQWVKGKTFLGVGCGVVPESQPSREWQELLNKQLAVKTMLGL